MAGVTWRVRTQTSTSRSNGSASTHSEFRLQELARTFHLTDHWSFIAGKRVLSWDVGFSATPLGFFQRAADLTDPSDQFERAEGVPLIALSYIGSAMDATVVYSDGDNVYSEGLSRHRDQLAANFTWTSDSGSYSLVVHKARDQRVGMGAAASITLTDHVSVHGSAFARKRSTDTLPSLNAHLPEHHNQWVVGLQWVPASKLHVLLEWTHDDAPAFALHEPDQDYVFIRAGITTGRTLLACVSRTAVAHSSTFLDLSISHEISPRLSGGLGFGMYVDNAGSAAQHTPMERTARAWFKYAVRLKD